MKIVVFTKNWIGDVIFETPAIKAIKENYPDSHLIAITTPRSIEVLEHNPYVNEIIPFEEKRTIFSTLKLIWTLRKCKIDKAFLFHRSKTPARIAFFAGAKERIGYNTKNRRFFLTTSISEPEGPIHDVQYFLDLVKEAGIKVNGESHYEFHFSEEDVQKVESLLQKHKLDSARLIALNPGANWAPKRWPPSYFRKLANQLTYHYGVQIVLTGSPEDSEVVNEILDGNDNPSIVSLSGQTSLRELGALFSKCQLVISNDTGPLHIAAGAGTNVIGIFGPTQPLETAPRGSGKNVIVQYAHPDVELPWIGKDFPSPWMELISVESILNTIEREKLILDVARRS